MLIGDRRRPYGRLFRNGVCAVLSGRIYQYDRHLSADRNALSRRLGCAVAFLSFIPGVFWLAFKVFLLLSIFIWARATFPRYRYDQIMRLGWKVFIPISLVWLIVISAWAMSPWSVW